VAGPRNSPQPGRGRIGFPQRYSTIEPEDSKHHPRVTLGSADLQSAGFLRLPVMQGCRFTKLR